MRSRLSAFLAVVVLAGVVVAVARAEDQPPPTIDRTPLTCDPHAIAWHMKDARAVARVGYRLAKWRDPKPLSAYQRHRLGWHVRCSRSPAHDRKIRRYTRKRKATFHRYRSLRRVTAYNCGGRWSWWAIPCSIISCESGFSWSAYNPSGASGPYQLLGWGAPMPANTWARKLAHHRIAASVWAGGAGRSNWVC